MILIASNSLDTHADLMEDVFKRFGATYARLNTDSYPNSESITWDISNDHAITRWSHSSSPIDLSRIDTVWFRRPETPKVSPTMSEDDHRFATAESSYALRSLWQTLNECFWVNPYEKHRAADHKPFQLSRARAAGLEVPRTLISNDPKDILSFAESCSGGFVYKTLEAHFRSGAEGRPLSIYTNPVPLETLRARVGTLHLSPGIFQEEVPKARELRVTIIGDKLFTLVIDSQKSERAKNDWRHYDLRQELYSTSELPQALVDSLYRLMSDLGLVFGCIDLVLTPDGRYVFLEVNPGGQWFWVQLLTKMPLIQSFAAMLMAGSSTYEVPDIKCDDLFPASPAGWK